MKKSILLAGIVGAAALCSCADDADSLYLNAQARFTFNYANAVPILYTALNSPGQFCFASCKINSQGYISSYHSKTHAARRTTPPRKSSPKPTIPRSADRASSSA